MSDDPDQHQPPDPADAPVVVFDLGGVLAHPEDLLTRLAAIADLEPAAFETSYWAHRPAYDAGCPDADYWGPVVADAGGRPSTDTTRALTDADCALWGDLPIVSRRLLADLVDAGVRLGLLSNAPTAMARWVRGADWAQPFEHLVVSGQQGCMKPDPVIYQLTTALFAVEPAAVTFFDDREDNVAAARAVGWDAHVWAGPAQARVVLAARGVPGPRG